MNVSDPARFAVRMDVWQPRAAVHRGYTRENGRHSNLDMKTIACKFIAYGFGYSTGS